ncbi:unnamed protein product [Rhizoctonia solani]|uniref:Uncharacterized protein n=1 Tax=Rhizoctonia solani TaxID=456999 RepID=A0A8H3GWX1_9AGAM|nr:unnamed protein product [Rhizoctonia solani]
MPHPQAVRGKIVACDCGMPDQPRIHFVSARTLYRHKKDMGLAGNDNTCNTIDTATTDNEDFGSKDDGDDFGEGINMVARVLTQGVIPNGEWASVASLKSKWRVPSSEEELEGELVKKTDKRNNASTPPPPSSEEEEEPKKSMLSARERARRKMRPRPEPSVESQEEAEAEPESKDNKAQQGKKDELEMEVEVDGELSKPQHPVSLSESNDPGYLNKVASGSKRGQKRTASRVEEFEEGGGKGDDFSSVGYQPSDDGMRVVKVTKMSVKVPDLRAVATRTRHKTA